MKTAEVILSATILFSLQIDCIACTSLECARMIYESDKAEKMVTIVITERIRRARALTLLVHEVY